MHFPWIALTIEQKFTISRPMLASCGSIQLVNRLHDRSDLFSELSSATESFFRMPSNKNTISLWRSCFFIFFYLAPVRPITPLRMSLLYKN